MIRLEFPGVTGRAICFAVEKLHPSLRRSREPTSIAQILVVRAVIGAEGIGFEGCDGIRCEHHRDVIGLADLARVGGLEQFDVFGNGFQAVGELRPHATGPCGIVERTGIGYRVLVLLPGHLGRRGDRKHSLRRQHVVESCGELPLGWRDEAALVVALRINLHPSVVEHPRELLRTEVEESGGVTRHPLKDGLRDRLARLPIWPEATCSFSQR